MSVDQSQLSWLGPPQPNLRVVIEEFSRLIAVLSGQLDSAMQDASRDGVALGLAFHRIVSANASIGALARTLAPDIEAYSANIEDAISEAVTALQFQDRLEQRAVHVRAGLEHLRASLRDPRERSFEEWLELLRDVEVIQELEHAKLTHSASHGSAELF
jgi:hypothetical protein